MTDKKTRQYKIMMEFNGIQVNTASFEWSDDGMVKITCNGDTVYLSRNAARAFSVLENSVEEG